MCNFVVYILFLNISKWTVSATVLNVYAFLLFSRFYFILFRLIARMSELNRTNTVKLHCSQIDSSSVLFFFLVRAPLLHLSTQKPTYNSFKMFFFISRFTRHLYFYVHNKFSSKLFKFFTCCYKKRQKKIIFN